jgi:hypothetical protein
VKNNPNRGRQQACRLLTGSFKRSCRKWSCLQFGMYTAAVLCLLLAMTATTRSFGGFWKVDHALKAWRQFPRGFHRPLNEDGSIMHQRPKQPQLGIPVKSVQQLKEVFKQGYRVQDMDVRGDIASLLENSDVHPVVQALYERKRQNSKPGERKANDTAKIAIAVEGGGMRGCVSAGMISVSHCNVQYNVRLASDLSCYRIESCCALQAFNYLGLDDSIDVVYGSSAGSLVGAYFVAKQINAGMEVYYDVLTTAGKAFLDPRAILRSIGLGIFDLRLSSLKKLFTDRYKVTVVACRSSSSMYTVHLRDEN